ncbi:CoA transferase, partial [Methylobacterium platani]
EALLAGADVLVHGYRSDALARLGLDAAARARLRPGLVDVALDAYGWTGPWRARRGFDSLVQMSCGIAEAGMARAGADRPVPLPVQA